MTLKQVFYLERVLFGYLHAILKRLLKKFVWMLLLCVCLVLLDFVTLLTIYAVERNVVVYCHAYN